MTVDAAALAAQAERMRDQFEADRLATDIGCKVSLHPRFVAVFEVRKPAPGLWLLSGTPDEIRNEWRKSWLRAWLGVLGSQGRP